MEPGRMPHQRSRSSYLYSRLGKLITSDEDDSGDGGIEAEVDRKLSLLERARKLEAVSPVKTEADDDTRPASVVLQAEYDNKAVTVAMSSTVTLVSTTSAASSSTLVERQGATAQAVQSHAPSEIVTRELTNSQASSEHSAKSVGSDRESARCSSAPISRTPTTTTLWKLKGLYAKTQHLKESLMGDSPLQNLGSNSALTSTSPSPVSSPSPTTAECNCSMKKIAPLQRRIDYIENMLAMRIEENNTLTTTISALNENLSAEIKKSEHLQVMKLQLEAEVGL